MQTQTQRRSSGETCDLTLNVVVAYDDVPAGRRAMHALEDLTRNLGDEIELQPHLWRFDLLEDAVWRAVAAAEAANAQILLLSTRSQTQFPAAVGSWIQTCLDQKQGTEAAVVAILGPDDDLDRPDSPRRKGLESSVRSAGLDFFAPWSFSAQSLDSELEKIRHRTEAVTPTLDEILHSGEELAFRHWGINE